MLDSTDSVRLCTCADLGPARRADFMAVTARHARISGVLDNADVIAPAPQSVCDRGQARQQRRRRAGAAERVRISGVLDNGDAIAPGTAQRARFSGVLDAVAQRATKDLLALRTC